MWKMQSASAAGATWRGDAIGVLGVVRCFWRRGGDAIVVLGVVRCFWRFPSFAGARSCSPIWPAHASSSPAHPRAAASSWPTWCGLCAICGLPPADSSAHQGLTFEVNASRFDETSLDKRAFASAVDFVVENSRQKALEVQGRCEGGSFDLLVSADTVVVLDNQILEKPLDSAHAAAMLKALSGREHEVVTGVTLITPTKTLSFHESTRVKFTPLSEDSIQRYIATGEPFDKAGGYGIQSLAAVFVEGIVGDYYNVVGFPLFRFFQTLPQVL